MTSSRIVTPGSQSQSPSQRTTNRGASPPAAEPVDAANAGVQPSNGPVMDMRGPFPIATRTPAITIAAARMSRSISSATS